MTSGLCGNHTIRLVMNRNAVCLLLSMRLLRMAWWYCCINIKMPPYQYRRNSHYTDKTVSWPAYLYNVNSIPEKDGLYIEMGPRCQGILAFDIVPVEQSLPHRKYRKVSNISRTLVGNRIIDHSDVVGASPVGAAPTTSSFSTWHLASRDSAKIATRRYGNLLSIGISCVLY